MMKSRFNILIVEDDRATGKVMLFELEDKGYNTRLCKSAEDGLDYFRKHPVDMILVDFGLPEMSGQEFFMEIKKVNPLLPVIFITALQSVDKAVELLRMGAFSYLTKPLDLEALFETIEGAFKNVIVDKQDRQSQQELESNYSHEGYVFNSPKMKSIIREVIQVADSKTNILITGESGTGKEVIADIIHHCSKRKGQKFVTVNLAALPETLIEAELFGAQKGAYTGAVENRAGKFEEAGNGTLFMDEIGELSPSVQVKLLRVLQQREITRLGSNKTRKIDIRLITATNKDLQQLVKEKSFREDLYYRLNVIEISLPPLRERKEDIPALVELFLRKYNEREAKKVTGISKDALNALMKYEFPGNIRELENIVERALVLCRDDVINVDVLPVFIGGRKHMSTSEDFVADKTAPLPEQLTAIERNIVVTALKKHDYIQTRTADDPGISEARLRYRIKTLGIIKK
ncbi:MAG: sigma-54-dependent Fis family transcriptional regulator [bacterium]|nr:sigma-54-dependent Fis family transcriptional regulator [bacterium]